MSQRIAPAGQDFANRASGAAMLVLRVTLLGTLGAFIAVLGLSTWRLFHG